MERNYSNIPLAVNPFQVEEIAFQLTNRCTLSCTHCGFSSGPTCNLGPSNEWCIDFVRQLASNGIKKLMITGGEPLLRIDTLMSMIKVATKAHIVTDVASNGFWGTEESARYVLSSLADAGLGRLTLSVDRLHQNGVPVGNLYRIAEELAALRFPFRLRLFGLKGKYGDDAAIAKIVILSNNRCEVFKQPIFPVGRAAENRQTLRIYGWNITPKDEYPCSWVLSPFVDAACRWHLCSNGAVLGDDSPLYLGKLQSPEILPQMLRKHTSSPLFRGLRVLGPIGILSALDTRNGIGESFVSVCDLCITRLCSKRLFPGLTDLLHAPAYHELLEEVEDDLRSRLKSG